MVNAKRQTEVHQPCRGVHHKQQDRPLQPCMSRDQEEGSFWKRVITKLENLEEENWDLEVQTGSFCSWHLLETKTWKQRGS